MTKEEFIRRANEAHPNNKYIYDNTVIKGSHDLAEFICPIHGPFKQRVKDHLKGQGCPYCADKVALGKEEFVRRAEKVHPKGSFGYSLVEYVNNKTKVKIRCNKCSRVFEQTPHNHLLGKGCPFCRGKIKNTQILIEDFQKKWGNTFDYSRVEWVNSRTKVCIGCKKCGRWFYQLPYSHVIGRACPRCGGSEKSNTENFIAKTRKIHGNIYDYSLVEYISSDKKVKIICKRHNTIFEQTPNIHLRGSGCPTCKAERIGIVKRSNKEKFIEKANKIHNYKYDYTNTVYVVANRKLAIVCHVIGRHGIEHGEFWQNASSHLRGIGCPKCGLILSNGEAEIKAVIESFGFEVKERQRKLLPSRKELDLYLPNEHIGIEYDGLFWHSEKKKPKDYHLSKSQECEDCGISLIHIFEDEWIHHKTAVINILQRILNNSMAKVFSISCQVREITKKEAKPYLIEKDVRGFFPSSIFVGAFYGGNLIGVMSFKKKGNNGLWQLLQCTIDGDTCYVGIENKMLECFVNTYSPTEIFTLVDKRWYSTIRENEFDRMGFVVEKTLPPDYTYAITKLNLRVNKRAFRKEYCEKKKEKPSLTKKEMLTTKGIYAVWDCGYIKYVYKPNPLISDGLS